MVVILPNAEIIRCLPQNWCVCVCAFVSKIIFLRKSVVPKCFDKALHHTIMVMLERQSVRHSGGGCDRICDFFCDKWFA